MVGKGMYDTVHGTDRMQRSRITKSISPSQSAVREPDAFS
jgi:hypothetical protein